MARPCYRTKAAEIHQANIEAGWWKKRSVTGFDMEGAITVPRNIGELLCLVHSEIDEALEGHDYGLFDDHLPDLLMAKVEMADIAIRAYDILGYYHSKLQSIQLPDLFNFPPEMNLRFEELGKFWHRLTSQAMEGFRKGNEALGVMKLWHLLDALYQGAEKFQFDLDEVIDRKLEYNRNRADHKLENRAKEGGKKF